MYKTKVQELCQRRSWSLPDYQTSREGPDHNPRFTSTITVNGLDFQTPSPCRTAKESQNNAAMLAFHHFSQPSNPKPTPSPPHNPNPNPNPSPNPSPNPNPPLSLPQAQVYSFPQPSGFSFPQPSLSGLSSFPQPSFSDPFASSSTLSYVTAPSVSLTTSSSGSPCPSTDVDNILLTSKVLQPKFEEASQTSQISSPVTAVRDIMTAGDQKNMLHLYKNQLQSYAQKRNLNLPVYSSEWEGPPHAMRFKCKVTIDGQTFDSPKFYSTLKDAEHAAAEVALMSLSPGGVQEDHTGLYKNLLQEWVQREGFRLPVYSTNKSGVVHTPIFVSQVEVEGELFSGQEAKSKKQAEMSAAKVAYTALKERKGKSDQSSLFPLSAHQGQAPDFSSDSSESIVITGLQHHANPKSPVSSGLATRNQPDKDKGKSGQSSLFPLSAHQGQAPQFSSDRSESNVITGQQHHTNPKSPVSPGFVTRNQPDKDKEPAIVTVKKGLYSSGNTNGSTEDSSVSDWQAVSSISDSTNVVSDTINMPSTAVGTPSRRRKVVVYSRKTNVTIEEGGTLMPISDDKWVAYSYSC